MRGRARLRGSMIVALSAACCWAPAANAEEYRRLSDAEIKRLITGKEVTDNVHYTDYFKAGGSYEGVFMGKRYAGVWKVKGGQLCVIRGSDPPQCDEFWRSGRKLQRRKPGLPNVRDDVVVRAR